MNDEGNIGIHGTIVTAIIIIISKILYTSPAIIAQTVGTAGWLVTIISCIISIIAFLILCSLLNRFPDKNIIEINDIIFGKILGKFISFLITSYIVYYAAIVLREFLEMIRTYTLPNTPPSIIIIPFMIVIAIIALNGLEGIVRLANICFYPIIAGLIILLLLAVRDYNFNYIFPIYGYGIKNVIKYGILRSSAYDEIFILAIIANSLHGNKMLKSIGLKSLVIAGVIFTVSNLCYIAIFQYTVGSENLSGIYELSRIIYINRFLQRLESVFLFTWVISSLITVAIAFYLPISTYCKIFKIDDHRPLILPFALIVYTISLMPRNESEVIYRHLVFLREYSFIFIYGLTVITLLTAYITGKKGKKSDDAKV